MKNEKLELLLNKVVEFNKPDAVNFKGFLYKEYGINYYIKVVEHISGTNVAVNDKVYLQKGDEQFVTHADKPKLMRVSLKSWHYRLIKFILRDNAPTPKTLQNGCPYFWLLVLSLLALPFVLIWKGIKTLIMTIPHFLFWCLKNIVIAWMESLDDIMAFDLYQNDYNNRNLPITAKIYFDRTGDDFYDYFLNKKYKLNRYENYSEYVNKRSEIHTKWEQWLEERAEKRRMREDKAIELEKKENERVAKMLAKRAARKMVWDARMKPIKEGFIKLFTSLKPTNDWKTLIKTTKHIVGAIITLAILAGTFFIVNLIAYVLIVVIDWSITNWLVYAVIAGLAAVAGILYILGVVVGGWLQTVVNNYDAGKKIWYIEPLIYLVWYPVKYIALFVTYTFFYIIIVPVKFIFYTFLWEIVLVNLGVFLWKVLCAIGHGLVDSTGVFGEYFGASYSDYCPGIEWVDTEEKK